MTKSNSEKKQPVFNNPFTENFMPHWDRWKAFKKEQFRFIYKPIGEQGAIDDLFKNLSGGNEEIAVLIINQSIAKGWRGLFELKTLPNATNIANPAGGFKKPNGTSSQERIDTIKDF